jgi:hypothetical protein
MAFSDVKLCGARSRSGAPCRQPGMRPSGKCKHHGGKTPRGLKNANLRTGRYSKAFPRRLQDRFEAAMRDKELLSLRKDIALLDSMLAYRLAELCESERRADPETINSLVWNLIECWGIQSHSEVDRALERLRAEVGRQKAEEATCREIRALIRDKARLISREHRRMRDLDQHLTVEEGMLLIRTLTASIRRAVQGSPYGDEILKMVVADYRAAMPGLTD